MNKKSQLFKVLIIIIIIVAIVYAYDNGYFSKNYFDKTFNKLTNKNSYCEEFAKTLFPKNINLMTAESYIYWRLEYKIVGEAKTKDAIWNDGTKISAETYFEKGSNPGENINYFYYRRIYEDDLDGIRYGKTLIDSKGDIVGDFSFGILPTLKPSSDLITLTTWMGSYNFQETEILDYSFVDCSVPQGINLSEYIKVG